MYTMPEILMAIAAISALGYSWITAWRQGETSKRTELKVDQTLVSAKVTEGHVNSKETKYVEELASIRRENDLLRKVISDKDATAALLAQAVAGRAPSTGSVSPNDPTLDKIEINTDATAKNTAKTDATVTKLRKRT